MKGKHKQGTEAPVDEKKQIPLHGQLMTPIVIHSWLLSFEIDACGPTDTNLVVGINRISDSNNKWARRIQSIPSIFVRLKSA